MKQGTNIESHIPVRRKDLVSLCINEGLLDKNESQNFRDFCSILSSYYHFRFHSNQEILKDKYFEFNPDELNVMTATQISTAKSSSPEIFVCDFVDLLQSANYQKLTDDEIKESFEGYSLIPLKTRLDFNEFESVHLFYRGVQKETVEITRFFRKKSRTFDNFERVVLIMKFKEHNPSKKRKKFFEESSFVHNKIYIYLYKNIPKYDIELIFPNVDVSMTVTDRLFLVLPALAAAIPLLLKVLPSLGLLIAAILLLTIGPEFTDKLGLVTERPSSYYAILAASLSLGATLGGFAASQYSKYKNKRLSHLKKVTETLFFKNLVTNEGVIHTIIDSAEEELSKETILVCYHLITSSVPLNRSELDSKIEKWALEKFGRNVDFDMDKVLAELSKLTTPTKNSTDGQFSLLTIDPKNNISFLRLDKAKELIDYIWDNAFIYNDNKQ